MLERYLISTNQFPTSIGDLDAFIGYISALCVGANDGDRRSGGGQGAFGRRAGRILTYKWASGGPPFAGCRKVKQRSTVCLSVGVAVPG